MATWTSSLGSILGTNQAHTSTLANQYFNHLLATEYNMGSSPLQVVINGPHIGQVRFFREKFKEYSKEDFRKLSKEPLVKEMLAGMVSIPKEDVAERIKQHLDSID